MLCHRIIKIVVFLFYIVQQSVSAYQKYEDDSTSYLSHFSGFIIGFLIGFVALENREGLRKDKAVKTNISRKIVKKINF